MLRRARHTSKRRYEKQARAKRMTQRHIPKDQLEPAPSFESDDSDIDESNELNDASGVIRPMVGIDGRANLGAVDDLCELFDQIDVNGDAHLEWEEFTSFVIEHGMAAAETGDSGSHDRYLERSVTAEPSSGAGAIAGSHARSAIAHARCDAAASIDAAHQLPDKCPKKSERSAAATSGPTTEPTSPSADASWPARLSSSGATVRAGILDAGAANATVRWTPEPDAELELELSGEQLLAPVGEEARPRVDLLLAMPRPLQFARVLPMVSSLGVGRIYVSGAARCPKDYFSSHLLRDDDVSRANLRAALVEGLAQSGDTAVPRVEVHRSLWRLLKQLGPPEDTPGVRRLLCHPRRADDPDGASAPLGEALRAVPAGDRVLLAVGPEGGWDEPDGLDSLARHGFERVTLGERTLRTDVAVVSLLAIANEHLAPP